MGPELLEIEPRELRFIFELKKQSSCSVQLTNNTSHYVAFKVKTTSPKRYCVRPNSGIVLPKSTLDFTVTLQAQREAPSSMQCRDKFLVQSTIVPFGTTEEDIKPDLFSKESGRFIEENKLKVVFLSSPHSPVLQQLNGSFKKDPASEDPVLKEAPFIKEKPVVREAFVAKEVPVLEEVPVVKESPGLKEAPLVKQAPDLQEACVVNEAPVLKEAPMLKQQDFSGIENIHASHVAKDVEELKSKLNILESSLNETEKKNSTLREEKSLAVQERDQLQQELVLLRRKCVARVQVGFPLLFVCFIGLVGVTLGYMLHR